MRDTDYQTIDVTYQHFLSSSTDYRSYSIVGTGIGQASSVFPMSINLVGPPENYNWYWGKSGYGQFGVYRTGYFPDAAIYVSYGHSTVSLSPSITFISPDLSIGFSQSVVTKGGGLVESSL